MLSVMYKSAYLDAMDILAELRYDMWRLFRRPTPLLVEKGPYFKTHKFSWNE
jgi:hypothetical protein